MFKESECQHRVYLTIDDYCGFNHFVQNLPFYLECHH